MRASSLFALVVVLMACGIPDEDESVLNDAEARASAQSAHDGLYSGILESDVESLSHLLDDDLTLSYPDGRLGTKDDLLERLAEGAITYDSANIAPAQPRLYDNVAIFNGLSTLWYTSRGESNREDLRYTAVYLLRPEGWRMVAYQSTLQGH